MPRRDPEVSPSARRLRVGEEVRHVLALLLAHGDLRDPALAGRPVTVTEVRMSPDLRRATAYIMPLGGDDPGAVLDGLGRAGAYLSREVGRRVRLKFVPEVGFELDATFDHAGRIGALISEARRADGDDGAAP